MSKTKKLIDYEGDITLKDGTPYERKFIKSGLRKISRNDSKKELREQLAEWQEEIDEQMDLIMLEAAYYRDQQELEESINPDLFEIQDHSFKDYTKELCALGQLSQLELVCSEGLHPDDTDYDW